MAFSCGSRDDDLARDLGTSRCPPLIGVEVYPHERSPFTFVGSHGAASVGDKLGSKLCSALEERGNKTRALGRGSGKDIEVIGKDWTVVLGRWLVGKGLRWVVYAL